MVRVLRFTFPAILIFVVVGIREAASGLYVGLGSEIPDLVSLLLSITLVCAIGWWLRDDLRGRGESLVYCLGLFLWGGWWILLPYYLLKTRGRKALITIALFVAVWIAAAVIGGVIGAVLVSY